MASTILFRQPSVWAMPGFVSWNDLMCAHCGQPSVVPNSSSTFMVILRRLGSGTASSGANGSLATGRPISMAAGDELALRLQGVATMPLTLSRFHLSPSGRLRTLRILMTSPSSVATT